MMVTATRRSKKITFVMLIVLLTIIVTSPSVMGLCKWIVGNRSQFRGNGITLPFMWSEEADDSLQKRPVWTRPRATLFNLLDDKVALAPPYTPPKTPEDMAKWHDVYGSLSMPDAQSNTGFTILRTAGIECGKLQYSNSGDGQVAIACISADHQATVTYLGSHRQLGMGLNIIGQALK